MICSFPKGNDIKNDYFIVLPAIKNKEKKMSLIKIQINILSGHYSRTFDAWKINAKLYECLERHGNNSFYAFKTLCQFKSSMIDERNNELICAIPSKKNVIC